MQVKLQFSGKVYAIHSCSLSNDKIAIFNFNFCNLNKLNEHSKFEYNWQINVFVLYELVHPVSVLKDPDSQFTSIDTQQTADSIGNPAKIQN